ncbi:MAG: DUF4345 domain-containing protein [Pseudomonadota bacterium]
MIQIIRKTVLAVAGMLLCAIGSALLLVPQSFLETSNIFVGSDPSLMSEISAPSSLLLLTGAFMVLGAFKSRLTNRALSIGAVVYGSYGIGRLVSLMLHGLPSQSLIMAMVIELIAAALLIMLRLTPDPENRSGAVTLVQTS